MSPHILGNPSAPSAVKFGDRPFGGHPVMRSKPSWMGTDAVIKRKRFQGGFPLSSVKCRHHENWEMWSSTDVVPRARPHCTLISTTSLQNGGKRFLLFLSHPGHAGFSQQHNPMELQTHLVNRVTLLESNKEHQHLGKKSLNNYPVPGWAWRTTVPAMERFRLNWSCIGNLAAVSS